MKNLLVLSSIVILSGCGDAAGLSDENRNNNNEPDPECGNAIVEMGEECDDGSMNSDSEADACRNDCRFSYCGDGIVDSDEECDTDDLDGTICSDFGFTRGELSCDRDACTLITSQCSTCGDGTAEGEEGDPHYETCDGSDLRGQDCLSIGQASGVLACDTSCGWDISGCTGGTPVCGDGIVEGMEECDDGNNNVNDACPDGPAGTCLHATCGDGFLHIGVETCDDGNQDNTDACPDGPGGTCEAAVCGDGFVWYGQENCDTLSDPLCHDCTSFCGDGVVDHLYEECDGSVSCSSDCQSYCGDGIVDPTLGEQCDEGTGTEYDPYSGSGVLENNYTGGHGFNCWADCTVRGCGDGICDASETACSCPQDCVSTFWQCDPVIDCNCPSGQGCGFNLTQNGSACRIAGSGIQGTPCSSDFECDGGYACLTGSPTGTCVKICWAGDSTSCTVGSCYPVGVYSPENQELGVCL